MNLRFGSVCSGIEAASTAWEPLGWQPAWFAEIEPFPSAVLAHHWPHVVNLGDMTTIAARVRSGELEAPDVLVGGTPCQAFSVAGARAGMADPRGQLTLAYVDLADAIDSARAVRGEPSVVTVWENVPGVLSSRDNAFGCFLGALAGESCELQPPGGKWKDAGCVFGPTRAVAWRVLDAQYFGLAQRRRRVFVVASARKDIDPAAILFELEGVRRDTPPSREARQETAGTLASRTGAGGLPGTDEACSGYLQPVGFRMAAFGEYANDETASTMKARDYKDATDLAVQCVTGDITHTMKAEGFDASEDSTGRGQPIVPVLSVTGSQADFKCQTCSEENHQSWWPTCEWCNAEQASAPVLSVHGTQDPDVRVDHAHTLGRNSGQENAVLAFQSSQSGVRLGETHATLDANNGPRRHNGVLVGMPVRRLTPTECERLQGFPEMVKTCTITVFQHSNSNVCLSDQQSTNVLAALQSHKSPNNASPAEENAFPSNANAAEPNLNVGQASSSAPVLVNAQIDLERQHLQLHSQGKLLLSVSIADASEWCRLPIQAADFVQLSAALLTWLERKAPHGRAESRLSTSGSFPLLIGNLFASQSGQEIEELASDAGRFTSAVKGCMKSITSEAGQSSQNCDLILQTLLCCVSTAISSFIPEETRAASSYALSVEVSHGYTLIPFRNKPAADGPRYKALGNSKAVPVVRWIGRRINAALHVASGSIA